MAAPEATFRQTIARITPQQKMFLSNIAVRVRENWETIIQMTV